MPTVTRPGRPIRRPAVVPDAAPVLPAAAPRRRVVLLDDEAIRVPGFAAFFHRHPRLTQRGGVAAVASGILFVVAGLTTPIAGANAPQAGAPRTTAPAAAAGLDTAPATGPTGPTAPATTITVVPVHSRKQAPISHGVISGLAANGIPRVALNEVSWEGQALDESSIVHVSASVPDAVADVSGRRGVDHPDDIQLDLGRQHVEQPSTPAEQHRDQVDLHLVEHAGRNRLLGDGAAAHLHVQVAGSGLRLGHRAAKTRRPGRASSTGRTTTDDFSHSGQLGVSPTCEARPGGSIHV